MLCCVTLHNIQNKHRNGAYDYDENLQNIANREPEPDNGDNMDYIHENENISGTQRQLQMISFFNNRWENTNIDFCQLLFEYLKTKWFWIIETNQNCVSSHLLIFVGLFQILDDNGRRFYQYREIGDRQLADNIFSDAHDLLACQAQLAFQLCRS